MIIMTSFFSRDGKYDPLLRVFEKSAQAAMPDCTIDVDIVDPKPIGKDPYLSHLHECVEAFLVKAGHALVCGNPVAVCDCDLMFLRPITDLERMDADVIYTSRQHRYRCELNVGLWFMQPTSEARRFVQSWIDHTKGIDESFPRSFRTRVALEGSIDQLGLRMALSENTTAKVIDLPCQEWNATQSEWSMMDGATRVVHVKSSLREHLLEGKPVKTATTPFLRKVIKKWKKYEAAG